jgi:Protein of unknwon function (DUF3008)
MPAKSKNPAENGGSGARGQTRRPEGERSQGPAKSMYESMSEFEEMAAITRKSKPQHASKKK